MTPPIQDNNDSPVINVTVTDDITQAITVVVNTETPTINIQPLMGSSVSSLTSGFASTANLANSASYAATASFALNGGGGGGVFGGDFSGSFSGSVTGSFIGDGSKITGVISSSYATTASFALSGYGPFAGTFSGSVIASEISASTIDIIGGDTYAIYVDETNGPQVSTLSIISSSGEFIRGNWVGDADSGTAPDGGVLYLTNTTSSLADFISLGDYFSQSPITTFFIPDQYDKAQGVGNQSANRIVVAYTDDTDIGGDVYGQSIEFFIPPSASIHGNGNIVLSGLYFTTEFGFVGNLANITAVDTQIAISNTLDKFQEILGSNISIAVSGNSSGSGILGQFIQLQNTSGYFSDSMVGQWIQLYSGANARNDGAVTGLYIVVTNYNTSSLSRTWAINVEDNSTYGIRPQSYLATVTASALLIDSTGKFYPYSGSWADGQNFVTRTSNHPSNSWETNFDGYYYQSPNHIWFSDNDTNVGQTGLNITSIISHTASLNRGLVSLMTVPSQSSPQPSSILRMYGLNPIIYIPAYYTGSVNWLSGIYSIVDVEGAVTGSNHVYGIRSILNVQNAQIASPSNLQVDTYIAAGASCSTVTGINLYKAVGVGAVQNWYGIYFDNTGDSGVGMQQDWAIYIRHDVTPQQSYLSNITASNAYVENNLKAIGNITASAFTGSGAGITGVISASYALSASWAPGAGAVSASYASTASIVQPNIYVRTAGDTMTGNLIISASTFQSGSIFVSGTVDLTPSWSGSVPLTIHGVATQSVPLTQWLSVSGTMLASVGATGDITASGNLLVSGSVLTLGNHTGTTATLTADSGDVKIAGANGIRVPQIHGVSDTVGFLINNFTNPATSPGLFYSGSVVGILTSTPKPPSLRGMDISGSLNVQYGATITGSLIANSTGSIVLAQQVNDTGVPLTIYQAPSSSNTGSSPANLMEFYNWSGSLVAYVSTSLSLNGSKTGGQIGVTGSFGAAAGGQGYGAGFVVNKRMAVSEVAVNSLEIGAGSGGSTAIQINNGGNTTIGPQSQQVTWNGSVWNIRSTSSPGWKITNGAQQGNTYGAIMDATSSLVIGYNGNFSVGQVSTTAQLKMNVSGAIAMSGSVSIVGGVNPTSVNTIPLVVYGQSTQSGSLQEWQNSAGTMLTSVSASGDLVMNNTGSCLVMIGQDGLRYKLFILAGGAISASHF